MRGYRPWAVMVIALGLLGPAAGCEGDKKTTVVADAGSLDAGPPQPVLGGKLGAAVAAAESAAAAMPTGSAAADGPPENGVFSPDAAAKALPATTPYNLELLGNGSEPRSTLTPAVDAKSEKKVAVTLGLRLGGNQGLPNLDVEATFKVEKPKKAQEKDEEGAGGDAISVTAKVLSATVASMGLGGPPKELTDELAKLKGSTVSYRLSPTNFSSDFKFELAKGAKAELDIVLRALAEGIAVLSVPLPDKPVGAGAYWMVTDRGVAAGTGVSVIRYRVFKIEKMEQDRVTFSLDTRQYSLDSEMKLPSGGGQEIQLSIGDFDSSGKGSLVWEPKALVAPTAQLTQKVASQLSPPGGASNQRMVAQTELTVKFRLPAPAP